MIEAINAIVLNRLELIENTVLKCSAPWGVRLC